MPLAIKAQRLSFTIATAFVLGVFMVKNVQFIMCVS